MALSRCRVSYRNLDGIEHAIEVEAESLYEAVALAVAEFRESDLDDLKPDLMSEFLVTVYRKPTEHRLRLRDVEIGLSRAYSVGLPASRAERKCANCWAAPSVLKQGRGKATVPRQRLGTKRKKVAYRNHLPPAETVSSDHITAQCTSQINSAYARAVTF